MLSNSDFINFVATSNISKAREFYERTLGLTFFSGDQFALVFKVNERMLRVQIVEKVDPHPYTALGWEVNNISMQVRELTNRGVKFARYDGMKQDKDGIWTSPSGAKIAWFNDPDGNILSLTEL